MFNWLYQIGEETGCYDKGLYEHLCGRDVTCSGFFGTPYGTYLGWIFLISTLVILLLFYRIIDHPTSKKLASWWVMALVLFAVNFLTTYLLIHGSLHPGGYCKDLHITSGDVFGVALFNALLALLLACLLSAFSWPRKLISTNNTFTTFYPNH